MISRLVLVGMVAALGLSIPNWPEFERGFNAFRSWTTAHLAEWDSWQPNEDDAITVPEVLAPSRPETGPVVTSRVTMREQPPALARNFEHPERAGEVPSDRRTNGTGSSLVAQQPSRTVIAFEPIRVDDDLASSLADELNRLSEGLEIRQATQVNSETRTREVSIGSQVPATIHDLPSSALNMSVESRLALGLCQFVEVSRVDQARSDPTEASDPVVDIFDENPEGYEPTEEGLASDVRQQPIPTAEPSFELIEPCDELTDDLAWELNRLADGTTVAPEARTIQPPRQPTFEPIILAEDLDSGTAYELNRASEGLRIVPPEAGRAASQRESARSARGETRPVLETDDTTLRRAVRMTRDAARAWMDVLTGPTSDQMAFR
jgi:hypothetical protein